VFGDEVPRLPSFAGQLNAASLPGPARHAPASQPEPESAPLPELEPEESSVPPPELDPLSAEASPASLLPPLLDDEEQALVPVVPMPAMTSKHVQRASFFMSSLRHRSQCNKMPRGPASFEVDPRVRSMRCGDCY
jgi:hypothetical protein